MAESIPPNVERLTRQYVDGQRFTSSNDVLLFAMTLFGEFEHRYHDQLGDNLHEAFKAIDDGDGILLNGTKEVGVFFADLMEPNGSQSRSSSNAE